jgi:TolB-like protein
MRPTKKPSSSKKYPPGSFMGKVRKRRIIETFIAFVAGGVAAVEFVYHILVHNYNFPKYTTDITIIVITFAMLCTVTWRWFRGEKGEETEEQKAEPISFPEWKNSIVVLPFENISSEEGQDYFCDGMTEEIITDLSHIHDLRVISRSSAMMLKGSKKAVRDIAEELNVQYVLEGSVRKTGNNLRITAQLIDATKDAHLWADKYSGKLDDVFDIQERVSRSIVDALKLKLSAEEKRRIAERPIDNALAYEYYLKARQEQLKMTKDGLDSALQYLQKGEDILGENVLLLAGMGYVYYEYINTGIWTDDKYIKKAEEYAQKIFELEPDSPYGHLILGLLKIWWKSPQEGIRHLKNVLSYNPNDLDALLWLCAVYANIGQKKAAFPLADRFMEIDPLNEWAHWLPGFIQIWDGQFDTALDSFERFSKSFPNSFFGPWFCALSLAYIHNFKKACSIFERLGKEMPGFPFAELGLKFKAAMEGNKVEALHWKSRELETWAWRDFQVCYYVSQVFSMVDAKKEALDWIEHAVDIGMTNYPFMSKHDPFLENIREEPRFKKLIERVKHEWENFKV